MTPTGKSNESFLQHFNRIPIIQLVASSTYFCCSQLQNLSPLFKESATYARSLVDSIKTYTAPILGPISPFLNYLDALANQCLYALESYFPALMAPPIEFLTAVYVGLKPLILYPFRLASTVYTKFSAPPETPSATEKPKSFKDYFTDPSQTASQYVGPNILASARDRMLTVLRVISELMKILEIGGDNPVSQIDMDTLDAYLSDDQKKEIGNCDTEEERRNKLTLFVTQRIKTDIQWVNSTLSNVLPGPLKSGYSAGITLCESILKDVSRINSSEIDIVRTVAAQGLQSLKTFVNTSLTWLEKSLSEKKQN
ncbi:hypothetical protein ACOME3_003679 [Neoechinorhynchus agilis]